MDKDKIYQINDLLRSINKSINRSLFKKTEIAKINPSVLTIMMNLKDGKPKSLKELSTSAGLANSTVSGIVERLVKDGMLNQVQDTEDRRRVLISATDKALKLQDELNFKYREYVEHVLRNVDSDDMDVIVNGLTKLNDVIMESRKK